MAVVYARAEGWTLVDAAWFSFNTCTTIGLGDLAPGGATRDWIANYVFTFVSVTLTTALLISSARGAGELSHVGSGPGQDGDCSK